MTETFNKKYKQNLKSSISTFYSFVYRTTNYQK